MALPGPALAVFGGSTVADTDPLAKTMAAIIYHTADGTHLCTAVALAPRLLLTAAHCTGGERSLIRIVFGVDLHYVTADRSRAVADIAVPPSTAAAKGLPAYENPDDLALVLLDRAAPAGTRFAAIADDEPGATSVRVAGYGATSELRQAAGLGPQQLGFDQVLRSATEPLRPKGPDLLVADQTRGAGVCTGDSGGPAFAAGGTSGVVGVLIGVASPRGNNDYCRGTAYFVALERWKGWITATAKGFGQPLP
jgi:secreted trypsin-like serine protease